MTYKKLPSLQFVITDRMSLISPLNSNDRSIPLINKLTEFPGIQQPFAYYESYYEFLRLSQEVLRTFYCFYFHIFYNIFNTIAATLVFRGFHLVSLQVYGQRDSQRLLIPKR